MFSALGYSKESGIATFNYSYCEKCQKMVWHRHGYLIYRERYSDKCTHTDYEVTHYIYPCPPEKYWKPVIQPPIDTSALQAALHDFFTDIYKKPITPNPSTT